jgi:hypothetical protein
MPASPADLLHEWHDFYLIVGAAAATLVGLMFVAASIGASIFNEKHNAPMRAFITPTVVHFSAALFTLLVTIPTHSWRTLAGLLGAGGLAGSIYCARILIQLVFQHQFNVDVSDRLFYAIIPLCGYVLALISAVLLVVQSPVSANVIAGTLFTLLLAGIRNAWDMTTWMMMRTPGGGATSS